MIHFLLPALLFKGGDDLELARALALQFKKPAVVLATGTSWASLGAARSDKELFEAFRASRAAAVVQATEEAIAVSDYTHGFAVDSAKSIYQSRMHELALKHKPVGYRWPSLDHVIGMDDLRRLGLKREYFCHPVYASARFAVVGRFLSEDQFAHAIADALGARVVKEGSFVTFEFDVSKFKRRMVSAFKAQALQRKVGTPERADMDWEATALEELPNSVIEEAYKTPGKAVLYKVPSLTSPLGRAAWKKLAAWFPVDGKPRRKNENESWSMISKAVDFSKPPILVLRGNGHVSIEWQAKPGGAVFAM